MKSTLLVSTILLTATSVAQTGGWSQKADMTTPRTNAVAFTIGNKGYIGMGQDAAGNKLNDLWEFNASTLAGTQVWTQKVSLTAGPARSGAVGFELLGLGYVGTGEDVGGNKLNDMYSFDPVANSWSTVAVVPGPARSEAVGFSIGDKGYVGLGANNSNAHDLYEYDPSLGSWVVRAQFPIAGVRSGAVGFSVGFHGFVGTGLSNGTPTDDFWLYDPPAAINDPGTWYQRSSFGGSARTNAVGFSMVGYGFIGLGNDANGFPNDFYRYNPDEDTWVSDPNFTGTPRQSAVGFSIGDRGFIGTGDIGPPSADIWQFILPFDCVGIYGGDKLPGTDCNDNDDGTDFDKYTPGCVCAGIPSNRWLRKADLTAPGRLGAVGFGIGNIGYVGLGQIPGSGPGQTFINDFWGYNSGTGAWSQYAAFPGVAPFDKKSFVVDGIGYVTSGFGAGTGQSNSAPLSNEVWAYLPAPYNEWVTRTPFPGHSRQAAVAFSIDDDQHSGYVGLGEDSVNTILSDMWKLDLTPGGSPPDQFGYPMGVWHQVADFGGGPRAAAAGFSIGSKGYVGTGNDGVNGAGNSYKDFWEFDPTIGFDGVWRQRAPLPLAAHARYNAVGIGFNDQVGFIGTGEWHDPALHVADDFWEFDPTSTANGSDVLGLPMGEWTERTSFGGSARYGAVGFKLFDKVYIATGNVPQSGGQYILKKDLWEYTPQVDCSGQILGPHMQGSACDDLDQFTENDAYDLNCRCHGTCIGDGDGDGICDGLDDCSNAAFPGMIGSHCDDGNLDTQFDRLTELCTCEGMLLDNDGDGIPNTADNCPDTPGVMFGPCADGDPCTSGEMVDAFCVCTGGTPVGDTDGDGVCNAIDDCPNTPAGSTVSNAGCACSQLPIDDGDACTLDECLNFIPTHTVLDVDGDGVCDAQDPCTLLAFLAPGDPCPCADPCDINCFVTAGCNCVGTFSGHSDNDGICDALDNCPLINGQIGSPCTDSDPCHIDGVIDANCECHGTDSDDHDGDGTCDALDTDWEQRPGMEFGRAEAVSFAIADSGYIATGENENGFLNDLWRYCPGDGSWSQRMNVPGPPRSSANGFAIAGYGYVCGGRSGGYLVDLQRFDPTTNTWDQKADFGNGIPHIARAFAQGFAIDGKGYIAGGYGEFESNVDDGTAYKADLWSYDPGTDTWVHVSDLPTGHRRQGVAFTLADKAYLTAGNGGGTVTSLDEYDPTTNTWATKAEFPAEQPADPRAWPVGFAIGTKGYVATGLSGNTRDRDCWQYDPATDTWTRQTDFRGGRRERATAFVIGDTAFVGTGWTGSNYMSDQWRFHPSGGCTVGAVCDDNDACTTGETWDAGCTCSGGVPNTEDLDQDGVPDCSETATCLNTPAGEVVNASGCSCSQMNDLLDDGIACTLDYCVDAVVTHIEADSDNDGICDALDNCPYLPGQNGDACGGTACLSPGTIVNCVCNATAINQQLGDTYATRIPITLDNAGNATVSGNNLPCFTSTYTGANAQTSPDVWYTITTGSCAPGNVIISLCGGGTSFDTYLHLLDASGTTQLAYNDDGGPICTGTKSSLSYAIAPNTTYIIVVEGYGAYTGTFTLDVSIPGLTADADSDGIPDGCDSCTPSLEYTVASTTFAPLPNTGTAVTLADDQMSGALPIGFAFNFYGTSFTNFHISSNGWMTFTPGQQPAHAAQALPSAPSSIVPSNLIAAAWMDLNPAAGGSINYATTGTSPNQVLTVTWTAVPLYQNVTITATVQIQLHEGSNAIEIHSTSVPVTLFAKTQGIQNSNGTVGLASPGRNQTTWTATNDAYRFTPQATGPGAPCDDGLASTTNDLLNSNCVCVGTPIGNGQPEISVEQPVGTALSGVVSWGDNGWGQTSVPAAALSGISAISSGGVHVSALKSDGSVIVWGANDDGQTTVPAAAQADVIAIASGQAFTLALKSNGSVVAWGSGLTGATNVPTSAQSGVTGIAAGYGHCLALKSDGSVIAWGWDDDGQATVPVAALSNVISIAAGYSHSVALKSDGSVVAWGNNLSGVTTVPAEAQYGIIAIAAGQHYTVALKSDGSVIGWGNNEFGQTTIPAEAQSNVTAIAANAGHVMALKSDGSVIAWGTNAHSESTVPILAGSGVTAISAGNYHSVVLKNALLPVGFGDQVVSTTSAAKTFTIRNTGTASLLGIALNKTGANPADFTLDTGGMLSSLPPGGSTTFSVTFTPGAAGTRSCTLHIVSNDNNENPYDIDLTGNGVPLDTDGDGVPDATDNCPTVAGQIGSSCNDNNVCTINDVLNASCVCVGTFQDTDGDGVCDASDPCPLMPPLPMDVFTGAADITGSIAVGIGLFGAICATNDYTTTSTPGDPSASADNDLFLSYTTGNCVTALSLRLCNAPVLHLLDAAGNHLAIGNGQVDPWCSSNVANGTGSTIDNFPVAPNTTYIFVLESPSIVFENVNLGISTVVSPDTDGDGICDVNDNCPNVAGQIGSSCNDGNANTMNDILSVNCVCVGMSTSPEIVVEQPIGTALSGVIAWGYDTDFETIVPMSAKSDIIGVSAGSKFSLALNSGGSVVAWGLDDVGQTNVPAAAQSGVIAIAAGGEHSLALKSDGSVIAWGWNPNGQTTVPAAVQSGAIAIAAGAYHSLALKSDGSVIAWGYNGYGQTTVPSAAQSGVVAIEAGVSHSLALKSDGSVIAWGNNDYGQTTVPAAAQSGITAIAAGGFYSLALKNDGSVIGWGDNGYGQTNVPAAAQSGVTAISATVFDALALKSDGSVIVWGENNDILMNVPAAAQSGVTGLAGGYHHALALKNALLPSVFADQVVNTTSTAKTFTIRNTGNAGLTGLAITKTGANPGDFMVNTSGMLTTLQPGGSTTFSVTFTPGATSARACTLHIASNDNNENPYDIELTGNGTAAAVEVAARVFLEGPYNSGTGLMSDNLRDLPSFALTEPFTALGYTHTGGGGGESTTTGVLSTAGNNAIVDWILLELRSTSNPASILASRAALVQCDGDVVDVDGSSPVTFNTTPGNYYVAVRHRNHLGCMAANPVALSASPASVDFTTLATATYGTNARKTSGGAVPVQVLWAGDVTFNGVVKYTGSGNDRDPILIAVGSTTPNNVVSTYSTRDVNLNGQVKYTGSGNDRDPILVNVGSTTPNNIRVQQLP